SWSGLPARDLPHLARAPLPRPRRVLRRPAAVGAGGSRRSRGRPVLRHRDAGRDPPRPGGVPPDAAPARTAPCRGARRLSPPGGAGPPRAPARALGPFLLRPQEGLPAHAPPPGPLPRHGPPSFRPPPRPAGATSRGPAAARARFGASRAGPRGPPPP